MIKEDHGPDDDPDQQVLGLVLVYVDDVLVMSDGEIAQWVVAELSRRWETTHSHNGPMIVNL
jgi:hypothetical protein